MKILITGITGLFGSYLAKTFSELGEIHGLVREGSSKRLVDDVDFAIHWREGDLLDPESLSVALIDIDLVIHAAGQVSFDPKEKESLLTTNVQGTANLVNTMLADGVNKLIYVSSVAAIGRSTEQASVDENYKWTASPLNTDYALSKYWAELEAWRGEQEGLDLLVVNPSILLARAKDARSSTLIYDYLSDGRSYFPKGTLNYIDIRDAALLTRRLYEMSQWGQRFILNKESISYQEFYQVMGETFGLKAPHKAVSDWQLGWVLSMQRVLAWLNLGKVKLTKQAAMIAQQRLFFDNKKVDKLLAFEYRSLKETFQWAK